MYSYRYLEYRPQIQYKDRQISYLNEQLSEDYRPSKSVVEAIQITPTDLLASLQDARDVTQMTLDQVMDTLSQSLPLAPKSDTEEEINPSLANTLSLDDYIKAREGNDVKTVRAFETFHRNAMDGLTEAEVLPILLDMLDEIDQMDQFTDDRFFDGKASSKELEDLQREEEEEIRTLIEQDKNYEADLDELSEENHLKSFIQKKTDQIGAAAEQIHDIINQSLGDSYPGAVEDIVLMIAENPSFMDLLDRSNLSRFNKLASQTEDVADRTKRSKDQDVGQSLKESDEAQKKKMENRSILEWIENQSRSMSESDPMNLILMDMVEGVIEQNQECEFAVHSLYQEVEKDRLEKQDLIEALSEKKTAREMQRLTKTMRDEFDFSKRNDAEQVRLFIDQFGFDTSDQELGNGDIMHLPHDT